MINHSFHETLDLRRPNVSIYYDTEQNQLVPLEIDPLNEYFNEIGSIKFMQRVEEIVERWESVFEWLLDPKLKFSSAQTCLDQSYENGCWDPAEGFSFENGVLSYPGDLDMHPFWKLVRHVEGGEEQEPYAQTVYGYPQGWIVIVNEDGSFQAA